MSRHDAPRGRARRAARCAGSGLRAHEDQHGRDARQQRRRAHRSRRASRARTAPRCASSSTWTSAEQRAGAASDVVSRGEMLAALGCARSHSRMTRARPPRVIACEDGTVIGIIASTTAPFCARLRSRPRHGGRRALRLPLRGAAVSILRDAASRAGASTDIARRARARPVASARTTAAPRSAARSRTRNRSSRSADCARIRTARCTPAVADGLARVLLHRRAWMWKTVLVPVDFQRAVRGRARLRRFAREAARRAARRDARL